MRAVLIIFLLFFSACEQKPSKITYKGHLYFSKDKTTEMTKTRFRSMLENNNKNKSALKTGQIKVSSGDNLYNLAKKYKTTTRDLIDHNKLQAPYILYPGDVLNVPNNRRSHVLQSGENLTLVARKYNVSLKELASTNNLDSPNKVFPGQILILPYGANKNIQQNKTKPSTSKKSLASNSKATKKITKKAVAFSFISPISSGRIIAKFGPKKNGTHSDGVNIKAPMGTKIKSAERGKIVYVGNALRGYGNLVIIKHPNNWLTAYAHSDEIFVTKGQSVTKGQVIATVGSSGSVDSPQLHFGLRKGRRAVNPEKYLKITSS
jgi:murein DD-endopeptidase MepM/ murein hydrolase activator NlpD